VYIIVVVVVVDISSIDKTMADKNELDEIDDHSRQLLELNNRIKNDFMSYCSSFLQDDDEARECLQIVWNKYLQCVGDVTIVRQKKKKIVFYYFVFFFFSHKISSFFDTLPFNVKTSVLPKYQTEIIDWCRNLFHFQYETILYSNSYVEHFLRMIRIALKVLSNETNLTTKKAIVYVSTDFDVNLKAELLSSLANLQFEHVQNDDKHEDIIDTDRLEELIKRDLNDDQSYPFMIIANAG